MSQPREVWSRLPQTLRERVIDDITNICTEVVHARLRTHHTGPPEPPGHHLSRWQKVL
jgi:hypothetical protein